jgi:hypothetical protein
MKIDKNLILAAVLIPIIMAAGSNQIFLKTSTASSCFPKASRAAPLSDNIEVSFRSTAKTLSK